MVTHSLWVEANARPGFPWLPKLIPCTSSLAGPLTFLKDTLLPLAIAPAGMASPKYRQDLEILQVQFQTTKVK